MTQTKPITIITTIQPPDAKGKRKLTVAAAPDGEMPVTLTGLFADWHRLEAEAYVAVSTRKAQVVKQSAVKAKGKAESETEEADQNVRSEETPDAAEAEPQAAAEADSLTEPVATDESQLPLIEGDH